MFDIRAVNGSMGTAFQGLGLGSSYIPSPWGVSRPQYVDRSILVAIMLYITLWTNPFALAETKSVKNMPTSMAALTGWKEPVNKLQLFTIPFAFVLKHRLEFVPRGVGYVFGQSVVFEHFAHIKIFDTDYIESTHKVGGDFVEIVDSGIRELSLDFGHTYARSLSSVTSFLSAGHYSLSFSQFPLYVSKMPWVRYPFSIRECGQSGKSHINAYGLVGLWHGLNGLVQGQCHKVSISTVLGYRDCGWDTCKIPGPTNLQSTYLGETEALPIPLEGRTRVFSGLFVSLLLKRRVSSAFGKEVLKSSLKMSEGLLLRNARDIIKPGFLLFKFSKSCGRSIVVNGLAFLVAISAKAQSPVVHVSTAAKHISQMLSLRRSWVATEFVSDLHKNNIYLVKQLVKKGDGASSSP